MTDEEDLFKVIDDYERENQRLRREVNLLLELLYEKKVLI